MRNYLILKEKARQFDEDEEIQALLAEIHSSTGRLQLSRSVLTAARRPTK